MDLSFDFLLLLCGLFSVHMVWNLLKAQHAALGLVLERRTLGPWFSPTACCTDHGRRGTFDWVLYSFVSQCLSYQGGLTVSGRCRKCGFPK